MHSYLNLNDFKAEGIANIQSDRFDERFLPMMEGLSRHMEYLVGGRQLFPTIATRYFSGNGKAILSKPDWDIISVTTLKEDEDADASYETTWASTDYLLAPDDNDPTDVVKPRPYWKLEVDQRSTGTKSSFGRGQRRFELTGKFGYCELTKATGCTIKEGAEFGASDTELTVDVGGISTGDTLVIESEYLYVTGQDVSGGLDFTVSRGALGSTAAAHADGMAVSKLVYPQNFVEALIMEASRLWGAQPSAYDEPNPYTQEGRTVLQLLAPFKRRVVG